VPSANGKNGNRKHRNANGTFKAGNPGGPGNPNARAVAHFRQLLINAVTDEEWQAITRKVIEQALKGKPWAVRELWDRILGKPKVSVEVQEKASDADPFEILRDSEVTGALERSLARRAAGRPMAQSEPPSN
jgi:hypothetical protein